MHKLLDAEKFMNTKHLRAHTLRNVVRVCVCVCVVLSLLLAWLICFAIYIYQQVKSARKLQHFYHFPFTPILRSSHVCVCLRVCVSVCDQESACLLSLITSFSQT